MNDWQHDYVYDERIGRDFIDNRSVRTTREAFSSEVVIFTPERSLQKVVPEPVDYSEKLQRARDFLNSKGITEVKSVRSLIYGEVA
jgi:hypothetical protein